MRVRQSMKWARRLGASILIGLPSIFVALVSCNSPDATVGPADGGLPSGSGGAGGEIGAGGGQGGSGGAGGGQGGAGGAGGGQGGAGGGQGGGSPAGPKAQWAKTIGSQSGWEYAEGLAIDALSDIYLAGRYEQALQFSDGAVLFPPQGGGGVDVLVTKFSPGGEYKWSKGFGGPDDEFPVGLGTDGTKLVVLGHYWGAANLGAGALPDAGSYANVFLMSLDPAGAVKWTKAYGDGEEQYAAGLGLDQTGNIFVTGKFQGSINFGGGGMAMTSAGSDDIFLAKLDGAGGHIWSKRFGDSSSQSPAALGVDKSTGGVVIAGIYDGAIDFGGGNLPAPMSSYTLFVTSFDANGAHKWSTTFQQDSFVEPMSLTVAGDGSVYVGGTFSGALGVGSSNILSNDADDIFIAKVDASGAPLWAKSFGNDKVQGVTGMAADADGGIVIVGYFSGTIDFGGGPVVPASTCDPGDFCHDAYLVKLAADGSHVYSRGLGGMSNDFAEDIAFDPNGELLMSGTYSYEIDFGLGQPFTGEYSDIFLAKLK